MGKKWGLKWDLRLAKVLEDQLHLTPGEAAWGARVAHLFEGGEQAVSGGDVLVQ